MLVLLLLACMHHADDAPREAAVATSAVQRAPAGKDGAAVRITHRAEAVGESTLKLTFEVATAPVVVKVWGTRGLTIDVPGDDLRIDAVRAGEVVELQVAHHGEGDLAVRVAVGAGNAMTDAVQSFTIGKPTLTPVPRTHPGSKGWDATRR